MSNFPVWWSFVMLPNNDGHASDGVDTRWGWTYPTWCDATRYSGGTNVTKAAFLLLTQDAAGVLAESYFWGRLGGLALPGGSDLSVIDWAWTSGGAIMEIQIHLGIPVDGYYGPQTQHAISAVSPVSFINQCCTWRKDYYTMLGLQTEYPGLYTRADACLKLSLGLIE